MSVIFLTGGGGKIGRALCAELIKKGHSLRVLLLEGCVPLAENITADLCAPENYEDRLAGCEIAVHLAAITHTNRVEQYERINSDGTRIFLEACARRGVKKFIFISTRAISADGGGYSRSKAAAEHYVSSSGLDWCIVRLAEVYGLDSPAGIDKLVKDIRGRLPVIIPGNGEYQVMPVFIADVLKVLVRCIEYEGNRRKTYLVAGPRLYTYNQLVARISQLLGLKKKVIHVPIPLCRLLVFLSGFLPGSGLPVRDQIPRLLSNKPSDISLARQELDFQPAGIEEYLMGEKSKISLQG